jgi:hypothetical protein
MSIILLKILSREEVKVLLSMNHKICTLALFSNFDEHVRAIPR